MARVVKSPQAMKVKTKGSTRASQGFNGNKPKPKRDIEIRNKLLQAGKKQGSKLDESDLDLMTLS